MKRRSFLTAALLAPLAPKLAALPAPAEPIKALALGEQALEMREVTNFAALTPAQMRVWSRDFWAAARNRSIFSAEGFGVIAIDAVEPTKPEDI